jgi:hypothetical protein
MGAQDVCDFKAGAYRGCSLGEHTMRLHGGSGAR